MNASNPDLQRALGKAAKERRKEMGFTQEELANSSDLHQRFISNVECGRRNLNLYNLRRVAKALKITTSELMARTERHERAGTKT